MGIAEQLEQIMKQQLKAHAAWMPVTNNYKIGDYGLISNGVFNKMGNIQQDFNISFSQAQGPEANLDFASDSIRVVKLVGGAEVSTIPAGAIDAKLVLKFGKEKSLFIKAPAISVTDLENVNDVFNHLKGNSNWDRKFIVVYQTYMANDAVLISTIDAETEIELSGDASALQQFKLGNASLQINSNKRVGLQILGKAGVIALGLVRIKKPILGREKVAFLGPREPVEIENLEDQNLEDDL